VRIELTDGGNDGGCAGAEHFSEVARAMCGQDVIDADAALSDANPPTLRQRDHTVACHAVENRSLKRWGDQLFIDHEEDVHRAHLFDVAVGDAV
jgi:hypothetical protein